MIAAKSNAIGGERGAYNLLANKLQVIKYLKTMEWTIEDMTAHEWRNNWNGNVIYSVTKTGNTRAVVMNKTTIHIGNIEMAANNWITPYVKLTAQPGTGNLTAL